MAIKSLKPADLCLTIPPDSLGFSDTSELLQNKLLWIGQERAEMATRFGLGMNQPDYNLFVLGDVGSGRSSLLKQAMYAVAADKLVPPDLCYLYNFDAPERPLALRLPAGQGKLLRQLLAKMAKTLEKEIPQRLERQDFQLESERIKSVYQENEDKAFAELSAFSETIGFSLQRDEGRIVFTLRNHAGHPLTENEMLALPKERRIAVERAEQALRDEITLYLESIRPLKRAMNEALSALRSQSVRVLLDHELQEIRTGLKKQIKDTAKLNAYLDQLAHHILDNLDLFQDLDDEGEEDREESLHRVLASCGAHLVVDNSGLDGAPVIVENNPLFRSLFGSIEYQIENDLRVTDFTHIRAGSLLKAHGGFLMLHLRDLLADEMVWEKLRRLLRSGKLQIEEPGTALSQIAVVSLEPEAVDVDVKIVLIGSRDQYYEMQEQDPEFARHFRVKVDFAESFLSSDETRRASSIFVAHACHQLGLPHFSAAAVARLLEDSHRDVDDQTRQSAVVARAEALVMESAELCRARKDGLVAAADVDAALKARSWRHDYPDQRLRESVAEGDLLIDLQGEKIGQINGLTQIDLGDYRFGFPIRISARTYAGSAGVLNIEREVELSGPIHDKGVFILQNYLSALFCHIAPISLSASVVFEQEYQGVEGDSASCAEFYALISSLSGVPIRQGIAVTGALNQHGEVLPVGGLNEKIEGYFRICESAGLDGHQGVLIPHRNRRHLMLDRKVVEAVDKGLFYVYTTEHCAQGIELLMGAPAGVQNEVGLYPQGSVLGHAQKNLQAFRRACHMQDQPKLGRRLLR